MWQLDKQSTQPLYQQIIQLIQIKIERGDLVSGDKLPSERQLANWLSVNRSTVIRAFDELTATGILERRRGSGTHIANLPKEVDLGLGLTWRHYIKQGRQGTKGQFQAQVNALLENNESTIIDGYSSDLPLALIPELTIPNMSWHDLIQKSRQQEALGVLALRQAIVAMMSDEMGVSLDVNQVMVTYGGQQAIFLLLHALLRQGDTVAVGTPSFFYSLPMFKALGIKTVGIPLTRDGLDLGAFELACQNQTIKCLFINSSFQNPTGVTMSLANRQAVIKLCQMYQVLIVEDDVFGLLRFPETVRVPLLYELAPERVLYIGSLTKVLGPTLQIGWLVAPSYLLKQLTQVRDAWELDVNSYSQVIATHALQDNFSEQLKQLRQGLEKRAQQFTTQLTRELGHKFVCQPITGGYYLWVTYLGRPLTVTDWRQMLTCSFFVMPSFLMTDSRQACRINLARLSPQDMPLAIKSLHELVQVWENS